MLFTDLADGESVFLDANVLVYHFTAHPLYGQACMDLLGRVDRQELDAFTSVHVLAEMSHRMMTIDASQTFGWPFAGIANRLGRHPNEVQQLTQFQRSVDEVLKSRIHVLTVSPSLMSQAAAVSRQTGLLTNDATIVAVMAANSLTRIASSDADFDRVPGITRYAPA